MRSFLAVLFLVVVCAGCPAEPINRVIVFGDSYSDIGRGYLDGNGPTAVAYLAQRLGSVMVPSNASDIQGKSLDFAVSAATTREGKGRNIGDALLAYGMKNQVQEFADLIHSGRLHFDPARTLFFLQGGLNDGKMTTAETVNNLSEELTTLYGLGARRFRVAVLPESIPGFHNVAVRLNPSLATLPESMRSKLPGAEIRSSQWGVFFDEVMAHPAKYGITNTTDRCAGRELFHEDATPCATPDSYFYYHAEHPSTAVHRAVGGMLYDELKAAGEVDVH